MAHTFTTTTAASDALASLDFHLMAGVCWVAETSPDGASYITVAPLARGTLTMTMETPVRVVTVSDGESLGGDDFPTLRAAVQDLYGVCEGETIPRILTTEDR